jgi:two-component system response regulator YesN
MENGLKHILIVDDEPVVLLGLKKLLSTNRVRVETAETYQSAMSLFSKNKFAVIIADLRLTGVQAEEGLDILSVIKKEHPQTRFILITGYGSADVKERALAGGADYYFEKPLSAYALQEALDEMGMR